MLLSGALLLQQASVLAEQGDTGSLLARMDAEFAAQLQSLFDWENGTNRLPPNESHIKEGSSRGVGLVVGTLNLPSGLPSKLMQDRAKLAKDMLAGENITKVIVSGSDQIGKDRTEASKIAEILVEHGVAKEAVIQEVQSTTTAEAIWYALKWVPRDTGKLYIITSDFEMPRTEYIFREVMDHFYEKVEASFPSPEYPSYPRLELVPAPVRSFCGSDGSLAQDVDPEANATSRSLSRRAIDELRQLGSRETDKSLYGPPQSSEQLVWTEQINVKRNPANAANFAAAMEEAMHNVGAFCACKAPPEGQGPELDYPLGPPKKEEAKPVAVSVPADDSPKAAAIQRTSAHHVLMRSLPSSHEHPLAGARRGWRRSPRGGLLNVGHAAAAPASMMEAARSDDDAPAARTFAHDPAKDEDDDLDDDDDEQQDDEGARGRSTASVADGPPSPGASEHEEWEQAILDCLYPPGKVGIERGSSVCRRAAFAVIAPLASAAALLARPLWAAA